MQTITLTYKGHGLFAARPRLALRKGQAIRAYIGPTPITDATRGVIRLSRRLAQRLAHDPELSVLSS